MGRLISMLVFFLTLVVILYTGLRSEPVPQAFEYQDLIHHLAAFAVLVCSARLAFPDTHAFWTVLYCLLFALMIELTQGLLPLRTPSVGDMAANIVGVLAGLALALQAKRLQLQRQARTGS
jgi:VanZ family protein